MASVSDGRFVVTMDCCWIKLAQWNGESPVLLEEHKGVDIICRGEEFVRNVVAISAHGTRFASLTRQVKVWDWQDAGEAPHPITTLSNKNSFACVSFSDLYIVAGCKGTLHVYDAT